MHATLLNFVDTRATKAPYVGDAVCGGALIADVSFRKMKPRGQRLTQRSRKGCPFSATGRWKNQFSSHSWPSSIVPTPHLRPPENRALGSRYTSFTAQALISEWDFLIVPIRSGNEKARGKPTICSWTRRYRTLVTLARVCLNLSAVYLCRDREAISDRTSKAQTRIY